jgi:hypothetical protein
LFICLEYQRSPEERRSRSKVLMDDKVWCVAGSTW